MAEQKRVSKAKSEAKQAEAEVEAEAVKSEEAEKLLKETDDLFDAIDEALGENLEQAGDFISSYVQKGGQ